MDFYSSDLEARLHRNFEDMAVYKNINENGFIKAYKLPAFMRDWILCRYQNETGEIDKNGVETFIRKFLPTAESANAARSSIISGNTEKFIAKIILNVDIKAGELHFELPVLKISKNETLIPAHVWEKCQRDLLKADNNWGLITLGYEKPDGKSKKGRILLKDFENFCPYDIDLEEYKYARRDFTVEEWIDIVFGAIDYNAGGYDNAYEFDKLEMLKRLLPFVEKRVNLIELAPKGTGKSYIFGQLGRYGWLAGGGFITRAKLFYDMSRSQEGLISNNDYVAFDEVQTISLGKSREEEDEVRGALKGYMECGKCTIGNHECYGDAGILLLGNISKEKFSIDDDMFSELPRAFQESALIDRFHGFIKGWKIKRVDSSLHLQGQWCLNTEYFTSIMHSLRDDASYRDIVDTLTEVPLKSDTRDTEAIKRICTAFMKLLFPHVLKPEDISERDFCQYCLTPAKNMRRIIKKQMAILDPAEFAGKDIPDLTYKSI